MPRSAQDLTGVKFNSALRRAGLSLPQSERASVLQTARWLDEGAARVATYLAADEKTGSGDAPC